MAVRAAQPVRRCCGRPATLLPCPARAGVRPVALRPTLSRGLPLSSDGAAGALGVGESKRCAKDRLPVVGAAEMGLRESVRCERERARPTYPAKRWGVASARSWPWNSGLHATVSMPGRATWPIPAYSTAEHMWRMGRQCALRGRSRHIRRMRVGVTRFVWTMAAIGKSIMWLCYHLGHGSYT
jgi:hypothetical protein